MTDGKSNCSTLVSVLVAAPKLHNFIVMRVLITISDPEHVCVLCGVVAGGLCFSDIVVPLSSCNCLFGSFSDFT